jgi:hypothetical protein
MQRKLAGMVGDGLLGRQRGPFGLGASVPKPKTPKEELDELLLRIAAVREIELRHLPADATHEMRRALWGSLGYQPLEYLEELTKDGEG